MADDLVLAADFPTATQQEWRALVAKVLTRAGTDFDPETPELALTGRTPEGIPVSPLYAPADPNAGGVPGQAPFTRGRTASGARAGWDVRSRQLHPEAKAANAHALDDLAGGASSLWLLLGAAGTPVADLPTLLDGVLLDLAAIDLDAGGEGPAAAEAFLALAASRELSADALHGCLGLDPVGIHARTGDDAGADAVLAATAALARRVAADHPSLRTITVDALAFHEAGATDAQELGASLAAGVSYLRSLTDAGLSVPAALAQLQFRYAATADQFATIAKLRAARRCWARIADVSGVRGPEAGQFQHASTSWSMMTRQDPWTNMLRTTIAAFAASVGGADAITVLPFDAALGLPDALARRIARNTPALLVEESHVAAVLDPAGGSGFVESLTDSLAQAAWSEFTAIEAGGGIRAALRDGSLGERIGLAREARLEAVTEGRETILGVNAFPLAGEHLLERDPAPEPPGGGLPRIRWAELLEATGV